MNLRSCRTAALLTLVALAFPALAADLDAAAKKETIDSLFASMRKVYVFPDKANEAERAVRARLAEGAYDDVKDGKEFARMVTEDMNKVCRDGHLWMRYSADKLPERSQASKPSRAEIEAEQSRVKAANAFFQRVERLPGNVGLIKLNGFADPSVAARPIQAAMDFVSDTDALIFDVRDNGGGDPATVQLLCSYLFGETPVHLNDIYFRPANRTTEYWTHKKVAGRRYQNREVYVLTSKRTGSGAEEFAYNLQNLRRGIIVGSSTWGGANPGGVIRLNDHFAAFVPTGRAINPITKTNWEGVGVIPDIDVKPEEALKTAHIQALKKLISKATKPEDKDRLNGVLAEISK
ncbi:MAG: S41 family peptidase [Fimbriimonas sp.]